MKLVNSINKVVSNDPRRHSITGVYLDKEHQKIVATNGSILAVLEPDEPIEASKILNIPKLAGKELTIDQSTDVVSNGKGLSATAEINEYSYPQWKNLISDKPVTFSVGIDAEQLLNLANTLLDRRSLEKRKDCIVRLDFISPLDVIKVSCSGEEKSFGLIMPCKFEEN
jgi:hypothetical protein